MLYSDCNKWNKDYPKGAGNSRSKDSTEIHCRRSPPERVQTRTLVWLTEDA